VDPTLERKKAKAKPELSADNTFGAIATEYIDTKLVRQDRAPATIKKARYFFAQPQPAIGALPVDDVDPQMLLAALKKLEAKGNYKTAKKTRAFASRVFRYGVATGRCTSDPAHALSDALTSRKAKHYAAILDPHNLGKLLRATASTLLNESGKWNANAIERSLAHGDSNAIRGTYSR